MFGIVDGRPIQTLGGHFHGNKRFRNDVADALDSERLRNDADEGSIFFMRQLEAIDRRLFQTKYADLPFMSLLPLIGGVGPTDEKYTWRMWDSHGQAQWGMPDSGMSIPKTNVAHLGENSSLIRSMVAGFGYNIREMRAAATTGVPLEAMRGDGARRAIAELQNTSALFGVTEFGSYGLFNQPGIQTFTPSMDDNSVSTWRGSNKTSQQIVNDVVGMIDQVEIVTKNVHRISRLLMSHANFKFIDFQPYVPGAGQATRNTIKQQIQEMRPYVKLDWALGLETAGDGGVSRMVGYAPQEDLIGLVLPVPFELFAPFYTGTGYDIVCHARMGEVVVRYPLNMIYCDGT